MEDVGDEALKAERGEFEESPVIDVPEFSEEGKASEDNDPYAKLSVNELREEVSGGNNGTAFSFTPLLCALFDHPPPVSPFSF